MKTSNKLIYSGLCLFYLVGFVGLLNPWLKSSFITITEVFLIINGLVMLWCLYSANQSRQLRTEFLTFSIVGYFLTLFIEIIGVATGLVFGSYEYGSAFSLKLADTPFVIGILWLNVSTGATAWSVWIDGFLNQRLKLKIFNNIYFKATLAGAIATLFDIFLEPVAIKLDFWQWQNNIVPLQNYLAWWIISASLSFWVLKLHIQKWPTLIKLGFLLQFLFMLGLAIFL